MEVLKTISYVSLVARIGLLVSAMPMLLGIAFAVRPNERWLSLMRPVTLAAIFASTANVFLGVTTLLIWVSRAAPGEPVWPRMAAGLAETSVLPFVGFECLTIAWLCVAIGMRRQE